MFTVFIIYYIAAFVNAFAAQLGIGFLQLGRDPLKNSPRRIIITLKRSAKGSCFHPERKQARKIWIRA